MGWRVVGGEVVVDSDHGDMVLDIETLRSMRRWASAQVVVSTEGPRVKHALTYNESMHLVETQYHQGIRGFLADVELV